MSPRSVVGRYKLAVKMICTRCCVGHVGPFLGEFIEPDKHQKKTQQKLSHCHLFMRVATATFPWFLHFASNDSLREFMATKM